METEEKPGADRARVVTIEKMVFGGDGLARTTEGVVLVPFVAPAEEVRVELAEKSKGVIHGSLLEVIKPSPVRVAPPCPVFGQCGGCQYQHINYDAQIELKKDILRESFDRIGKVKLDAPLTELTSEPYGYRNRVRLRVVNDSSGFRLGYFGAESHRLVAIDACPIASPAINAVISKLLSGVGAECFPEGEAEVELFATSTEDRFLVTVYSELPPQENFGAKLLAQMPEVASVEWRQEFAAKQSGRDRPARTEQWGPGYMNYRLSEHSYRVSHNSFFQANRFLVEGMVHAALEGLTGERALDLYAGVGLFSVALAKRFQKVAAVESQTTAAEDLLWNLKTNKAAADRARGYELLADRFVTKASANYEVVIVDPPRGGLNRLVIEGLARIRAPRIVYLSCDPTTLARDAAVLMRAGYGIRSARMIDQFPQTLHIESLLHLELK